MQLEALPDEMIMEIFRQLISDSESYRNFMMTCKRHLRIGNEASLAERKAWTMYRPIVFKFTERKISTNSEMMKKPVESACNETHHTDRKLTRKELKLGPLNRYCPYLVEKPAIVSRCLYESISCLVNCRSITFRSLKFHHMFLWNIQCLSAFHQSSYASMRTSYLVELELSYCHVKLEWLDAVLGELKNISHLILEEVNFYDTNLKYQGRSKAAKRLKVLRILSDSHTVRTNDKIFKYFLINFPATKLDLSGTKIDCSSSRNSQLTDDETGLSFLDQPAESMLTFHMILTYLKKYEKIVKKLIADYTGLTRRELQILREEGLHELEVLLENPFVELRPGVFYSHKRPRF